MYVTKPKIKTEIPGPKARKILEEDKRYISPSHGRAYPLVVKKAEGMALEDVDGNVFLDFSAGIAVASTGHCHPEVAEAVKRQVDRLIHISGTDFYYEEQIELARKLSELTPGKGIKKAYFGNSGAEAVEAAFKLCRWITRVPNMIACFGSFHGRTYGALSFTASKSLYRMRYSPLVPGVVHIPYPYCYRCIFNKRHGDCSFECIAYIEETVFRHLLSPEDTAGLIIEPIQGEGGYIVPPKEYFRMLRETCDKYNILLIIDEIQAGMGRTGKMFAIEHWGIIPDVITVAKGLASGLPIGACIAREELMTWTPGTHGSTFSGNLLSCVAGLKTIELIEKGLMKNAENIGEHMLERLNELKERHDIIGDVRGKGLMIGVELVKDGNKMAKDEAKEAVLRMFRKGISTLTCGLNTIRFSPPLVVSEEEADCALEIFEEIIIGIERSS